MKSHHLLISLFILAFTSAHAQQGKHLFILSGQSNMVGLKHEISFTPAVEKELGKEHVIIVKDAQSGCPIRRWVKNWQPAAENPIKEDKAAYGDLYDRLMGQVKTAIEGQKIDSVTFIWMQGERDAKEGHGTVYAKSFKSLIEQLKTDLQRKDIGFIIGRISDHGIQTGNTITDWPVVRAAQVDVAESDPLGAWVDTDDLNGQKNGLHYDSSGYAKLGERFAAAAIKLLKKRDSAR